MEIERKYLNADLGEIRKRLQDLGATSGGEHLETNLLLDTRKQDLTAGGRLLRLRTQKWPDKTRHVLTYKAPLDNAARYIAVGVKAREETEVSLDDAQSMLHILESLGYIIIGAYEKFREDWRMGADCHVSLDILPFDDVVEIEAPIGMQDDIANTLGLDKLETSIKSYYEIHKERQSGPGSSDLSVVLFPAHVKAAHFARLGLS